MSAYTDLITSEHSDKPNFIATVDASTSPFVDLQASLARFALDFDLDSAIGSQLDIIGEWVGISRNVSIPISGAYFSWGVAGLGWGQGYWRRKFDPTQGITSLSDEPYRTLLRATIALNHWDGTLPGLKAAISPVLPPNYVYIQDNQDMTMTVVVTGPALDVITAALLVGGYLAIKPADVGIKYAFTSAPPAPVFAWGVENAYLAGWGEGAWASETPVA